MYHTNVLPYVEFPPDQNPSFQKEKSPGMNAPERLALPCFQVIPPCQGRGWASPCMLGAVNIKWLSAQP